MKILLISQVFWPDTASTAQHLSDLAECLASSHDIRVISSRRNYETPGIKYPRKEKFKGIAICRINNTGFGKRNVFSRVLDFFSFNLLLFFKLFAVNRKNTDLILGMTSPPLVSFIGVCFAKWKHIPFHYWTMDLQPELSISSGLIKEHSIIARFFLKVGNYIFKHASKVIVLDKYMAEYARKRGAAADKIRVVPVWPVMNEIYEGSRLDNPFRIEYGFGDKIVVMYSGNHSFIHPLDTLLMATLELKGDSRFLFVFIGGGIRKNEVTTFKQENDLESIIQLDYQPRDKIHYSLGSADLHVVILGDNQVGFTHPNKIYGSMFIGKPIVYIGPSVSHVTDIISDRAGNIIVAHGDVKALTARLRDFAEKGVYEWDRIGSGNRHIAHQEFHPEALKKRMCEAILDAD